MIYLKICNKFYRLRRVSNIPPMRKNKKIKENFIHYYVNYHDWYRKLFEYLLFIYLFNDMKRWYNYHNQSDDEEYYS